MEAAVTKLSPLAGVPSDQDDSAKPVTTYGSLPAMMPPESVSKS